MQQHKARAEDDSDDMEPPFSSQRYALASDGGEMTTASPAQVLSAWETIDLPSVQLALDEQALQVAAHTERRLETRKELSALTKAFRTAHDREPDRDELLKRYQQTIDDVTQHAKFGGNAFLTLFRILRQLPDPVQGLTASMHNEASAQSHAQALEERVTQLIHALEKSREKAKSHDDLKADRERFQEQLTKKVTEEGEVLVTQALQDAEERLARCFAF